MNTFTHKSVVVITLVYLSGPCWSYPKKLKGGDELSNRIYDMTKVWPFSHKVIHYEVAPDLHFNKDMKATVIRAIEYMNEHSCVKWVQKLPWNHDINYYVVFDVQLEGKCSAHGGFDSDLRKHFITLTVDCYKLLKEYDEKSIYVAPLHEMMHVLGFYHEQQRPDRDCYITVPLHLIERDSESKGTWWPYESTDYVYDKFPYDYKSVMHYRRYDVHANDPSVGELGALDGTLSELDLWRIASVYCYRPAYCEANKTHCDQIQRDARDNPNCTRIDYAQLKLDLKRRPPTASNENGMEDDDPAFL